MSLFLHVLRMALYFMSYYWFISTFTYTYVSIYNLYLYLYPHAIFFYPLFLPSFLPLFLLSSLPFSFPRSLSPFPPSFLSSFLPPSLLPFLPPSFPSCLPVKNWEFLTRFPLFRLSVIQGNYVFSLKIAGHITNKDFSNIKNSWERCRASNLLSLSFTHGSII